MTRNSDYIDKSGLPVEVNNCLKKVCVSKTLKQTEEEVSAARRVGQTFVIERQVFRDGPAWIVWHRHITDIFNKHETLLGAQQEKIKLWLRSIPEPPKKKQKQMPLANQLTLF